MLGSNSKSISDEIASFRNWGENVDDLVSEAKPGSVKLMFLEYVSSALGVAKTGEDIRRELAKRDSFIKDSLWLGFVRLHNDAMLTFQINLDNGKDWKEDFIDFLNDKAKYNAAIALQNIQNEINKQAAMFPDRDPITESLYRILDKYRAYPLSVDNYFEIVKKISDLKQQMRRDLVEVEKSRIDQYHQRIQDVIDAKEVASGAKLTENQIQQFKSLLTYSENKLKNLNERNADLEEYEGHAKDIKGKATTIANDKTLFNDLDEKCDLKISQIKDYYETQISELEKTKSLLVEEIQQFYKDIGDAVNLIAKSHNLDQDPEIADMLDDFANFTDRVSKNKQAFQNGDVDRIKKWGDSLLKQLENITAATNRLDNMDVCQTQLAAVHDIVDRFCNHDRTLEASVGVDAGIEAGVDAGIADASVEIAGNAEEAGVGLVGESGDAQEEEMITEVVDKEEFEEQKQKILIFLSDAKDNILDPKAQERLDRIMNTYESIECSQNDSSFTVSISVSNKDILVDNINKLLEEYPDNEDLLDTRDKLVESPFIDSKEILDPEDSPSMGSHP